MKILIITTRFHPHIGGVEEVVANISENMGKENDVRVLSSLDTRAGLSDIPSVFRVSTPEEKIENYKNIRIWMNLPGSILGLLLFPVRFLLSISKLFTYTSNFNPDVINYHFPDDSVIYVDLLTSFKKIPLVVNIHGNDLQKYAKKEFHKIFIRRLLNRSSKIIVNSSYMRDELLKNYPRLAVKVKIIPNGLNVDQIENIPAKNYLNEPYIFYVGRIVEKKGVDVLIKAFYKMSNSNLKLIVEGKGEDLEKNMALAKKYGIDPQIIFTEGKLSTEEKIGAMKGALFGVIPSRIEPFGIVALEFMAAGTPVVVSETGGLKDMLRDKDTCLFFENGNVDALAHKMELMLSDQELREKLSENGIKEIQNYKWDSISNRYLSCFHKLK